VTGRRKTGRQRFFFEKKKQKTFIFGARLLVGAAKQTRFLRAGPEPTS
jgi:hypothetical protein